MKPAFCLLLLAISCSPVSVEERENITGKWEHEILSRPDFEWKTVQNKDFRLHVKKGSWYGERNEIMLEKVDSAWEYVQRELQETYTDTIPALFFFSHPDEMVAVGGMGSGGSAYAGHNLCMFAHNEEKSPPLMHELTHLFTLRKWGEPHGVWVNEGIAVMVVSTCADYDIHSWAAAFYQAGTLKSAAELEADFSFSSAEDYIAAGSFLKYIRRQYGLSAVRKFWDKGYEGSLEITGTEYEALQEEYFAFLQTQNALDHSGNVLTWAKGMSCE